MIELPYEIWLLIAGYLPDHQVRTLYSVNRLFFNIFLDLRYGDVFIGVLPDRVVEETKPPILRHVLDPSMSAIRCVDLPLKESPPLFTTYIPPNCVS